MNIVVSSNENYLKSLKIMLLSLFQYNDNCSIFLLYSDIKDKSIKELDKFIKLRGGRFMPILVNKEIFDNFLDMGKISKEA